MDPLQQRHQLLTRRSLLRGTTGGLGAAAVGSLLGPQAFGGGGFDSGILRGPHFAPKAKRVICLFMSGAPSQIDMWDHKPGLRERYDEDLPDSIRKGQRFTTMTSGQARFPVAPSKFSFAQHGQSGTWVSELLPHTATKVDQMAVVRSMYTEAINHDPAMTFFQSGSEQPGRPSLGAWLSYGLGSMNADLPTYVVMTPTWTGRREAQALYNRLWDTGFLPSRHQGVSLRAKGDPILYLNDPEGVTRQARRQMLDTVSELTEAEYAEVGDPALIHRLDQYEMAFRMQASVPDLVDIGSEPQHVLDLYGPEATKPGTFAASALLSRRLVERGVRFVQLYHRGWDQHGNVAGDLPNQCRDIDQACAGLLSDLEQRGLLEDTLVMWGGEFGRTVYCQGGLSEDNYGRDHHPRCFTWWLAGAGIKGGVVHGETDDYSYNIVKDGVHVHDLNATILHLLGIDHERLTHRFQGRDFRLTDVHGELVHPILA
ncbi:MAG: DUF1501 domain-containing protein [Planctomycetota bacterium]|nr:DUF1501 domain-containing protein [Planctomycetota bacterium]